MNKVMVVFGTRPEAIKMCPLVIELKKRKQLETLVCVTGQHRSMLDQVLNVFHVIPEYDLCTMREKQTLFDITIHILNDIRSILEKESPDIVLVHGDTTTAFVTSLACFYLKIPVGHVESGLRTYDLYSPYPEEFNRQVIDMVSRFHFVANENAKNNLLSEGKMEKSIYVTGNTVIDALKMTIKNDYSSPILEWARCSQLVILTAHRRENIGKPIRNMFQAIKRIVNQYPNVKVVYPIHKNPAIRKIAEEIFDGHENIMIIEPLDVFDFHNLLNKCFLVLTDSGGIQEESAFLGKPVLVMRNTTERPEGIQSGNLKLVGVEEETIYNSFKLLLENNDEYNKMNHRSDSYGDGFASLKIADIIEKELFMTMEHNEKEDIWD